MVDPLIKALIAVLTLGAPTTRDAAVEGLGALLKLVDDPQACFRLPPRQAVIQEEEEEEKVYIERVRINDQYLNRLERRHLMVLTIAGHTKSQDEFCRRLKTSIQEKVAGLCAKDEVPWSEVEDALYEYPDLLRILPAIERQKSNLPKDSGTLLCDAARLLAIDVAAPEQIVIAFARFQESVFRTIDVALRRCEWTWNALDDIVAAAVAAIPRSIAGTPAVCNAQIRATVAILRTAFRLLKRHPASPSTRKALKPMFAVLNDREPWSNIGIFEGCFRGLPHLVADSRYDDLTDMALDALFEQLAAPAHLDDLVEVHRHLVVASCFRRILLSLMDAGEEGAAGVEHRARMLLRDPSRATVQRACRATIEDEAAEPGFPADVAPCVIASVALEHDLLALSASMFQAWNGLPTLQKVLLTRILAAQLHTISRSLPELARYPILHRVFNAMDADSRSGQTVMKTVWELLSSLPAGAAATADAEVQRFVEYRGRSSDERVNNLPRYVLAMISTSAAGRIAGAIAREIDLNLRHERKRDPHADFAKALHQVTLRGPHESIFDHLLPRISDPDDRAMVLLFRRHVAKVLASRKDEDDHEFEIPKILTHVNSLCADLERYLETRGSTTLAKLRRALGHFADLTSDSDRVWNSLTAEAPIALFKVFDELARDEAHRDPLSNFE
ncbi:MAG: hypothetical protein QOE82_1554, partial [Thermoanaerobaculia bacterium]|nr:hypothetical protein [Thermoanaerobaculia bacterium]